jgi:adenosylmethionine-8-amino-7-oxononanoate aminotransferase
MTNTAAQADRPAVFGRDLARTKPVIVRAEGVRLWDTDGNEYIDASSGAVAVISIGHGREEVVEAMAAQARRVAYVHGGLLQHGVGEELARELAAVAPGNLNRVMFVSGGSEANEAAIKLARQYHLLRGKSEKHLVIGRERSYHGMTLGALSVSGYESRRRFFEPLLLQQPRAMACDHYRCPICADDLGCTLACADDLEQVINSVGADRVAAFIAEPIVAAAGPGLTPPPGYYERVRELCDRHDILFIADEVVTGFGKTGRWFGIQHWNAVPDVMTCAKGLSGGYVPLGAMIIGDHVASVFEQAGVPFAHGHTYMEHPVTCAAGLAVLRVIQREGLVENAARQGEYLFAHLRDLAAEHPFIGDVRGKGLLAGIELVADRETKRPFDPALGVTQLLLNAARSRGLMLYPGQSIPGVAGDQVLVSPPLIVTRDDVDEIAMRLAQALDDVREALG